VPVIPIIELVILEDVEQGFEIASGIDPQGISIIKNEINTNPIRFLRFARTKTV
jgi:hypothetical protein